MTVQYTIDWKTCQVEKNLTSFTENNIFCYMIRKAFKYRIFPIKTQQSSIAKTFGCCRFIYNNGLAEKIRIYEETGQTLSCFDHSEDSLLFLTLCRDSR